VRRTKLIVGLTLLALIATTAWQIGSWELAKINLRDDLQDMASQAGVHTGAVPPAANDEEVVRGVILKAKEHGIDLEPSQITVRQINPGEKSTLYLGVNYVEPVRVLFFSFNLHFRLSVGV
jgi:hypothetical protein